MISFVLSNYKVLLVLFYISNIYSQIEGDYWKKHVVDNSGFGADGVRVYSKNAQVVFTVSWEQSGYSRIYVYDEKRLKVTKTFQVPSIGVEDAITTDLEEDGKLDVITFEEIPANQIQLHKAKSRLRSKGSLVFKSEVISNDLDQEWMYGEVHDFNGDGFKDIVAGSKGNQASITLFINPGTNSKHWKYIQLCKAGWIMSIKLLDVDEDGDKDILFSDRTGSNSGIKWLSNPGVNDLKAFWKPYDIGLKGKHPFFLNVYKEKDSWVVYASEKDDGFYQFKKNKEKWECTKLFEIPKQCGNWVKDIALTNLDNDSELEIVTAYNNAHDKHGIIYSKRDYNNGWKHYTISGLPGPKFDVIKFFDMDGDGDLDVLNTEENDNSSTDAGLGFIWYENPLK